MIKGLLFITFLYIANQVPISGAQLNWGSSNVININENTTLGTIITINGQPAFQAISLSGSTINPVTFTISNYPNELARYYFNVLQIDSVSANLQLANTISYEVVQTFTFVATAYDNKGNSANQIYSVKVNNTMNTPPAPLGLPYSFLILENAMVGSTVFTLSCANYEASSTLTYQLDDTNGTFKIGSSSGAVTLTRSLNFFTQSYYALNFSCTSSAMSGPTTIGGSVTSAPAPVIVRLVNVTMFSTVAEKSTLAMTSISSIQDKSTTTTTTTTTASKSSVSTTSSASIIQQYTTITTTPKTSSMFTSSSIITRLPQKATTARSESHEIIGLRMEDGSNRHQPGHGAEAMAKQESANALELASRRLTELLGGKNRVVLGRVV